MRKTFLILASILLIARLSAQDFEVAPVIITFTAQPGETQKQKLYVRNYGTQKQTYNLKIADYEVDNKGNRKMLPPGTTKYSCANWLSVNPSLVELNPNQEIEAEVILSAPHDAKGSRWCQIIVEAAKEKTISGADKELVAGLIIVPRIIVLVKQQPKNESSIKAILSDLKETTKPGSDKRSFQFTVENQGDLIIDGQVYLLAANLNTAEETKFPPQNVVVYPGGKRQIELTIPEQLAPGRYALAAILDCGKKSPIEGIQITIDQN